MEDGLKAVAIYRDNSKRSQPLSAAGEKKDTAQQAQIAREGSRNRAAVAEQRELFQRAHRRKLPSERTSITHKFSIGGHEGYITVGMYETGEPRRNLHQDGEGRLDAFRLDGRLRAIGFHRLAVRRAAQGAGRQIDQHALRARRLHGPSGDPLRQIRARLYCDDGSAAGLSLRTT